MGHFGLKQLKKEESVLSFHTEIDTSTVVNFLLQHHGRPRHGEKGP